jgi:hypothetical protein
VDSLHGRKESRMNRNRFNRGGGGEKSQWPRSASERVSHAYWLEQFVHSLFRKRTGSLAHRFQSLETVSQLYIALTDKFIKSS